MLDGGRGGALIVLIFRFFLLDRPDSSEKDLPVPYLEGKGLAASGLVASDGGSLRSVLLNHFRGCVSK